LGLAVYFAISAKTHTLKTVAIFSKKSVPAEPGSRVCGIFDRSMFKIHYSKLSMIEHNFFAKNCECRRWWTLGRSKYIFLPT
jgi:hypothetical protein